MAKTNLRFITHFQNLPVAKVYTVEYKEEFQREVDACSQFDHPNIIKFVKSFPIETKGHAIIMPFYPRTASDLYQHYSDKFVVPMDSIATVGK